MDHVASSVDSGKNYWCSNLPTTANAGADQQICASVYQLQHLNGNTPAIIGSRIVDNNYRTAEQSPHHHYQHQLLQV